MGSSDFSVLCSFYFVYNMHEIKLYLKKNEKKGRFKKVVADFVCDNGVVEEAYCMSGEILI